MQGTEQESGGAQLSVGWQDGLPEPSDQSLEHAAAYAAILTRTLAAAGYQPRRLDVGLRRGAHGILEIHVHGDVPRMPEQDFASLARVTLRAANLGQDVNGPSNGLASDVLLMATLDTGISGPPEPRPAQPATLRGRLSSLPVGRLATGLLLGGLLGVLGLPRLELPFGQPSGQQQPTPPPRAVVVVPDAPTPALAAPTVLPTVPASTIFRPSTGAPAPPRVLFGERFASPLPNWPNNPDGTAWFGSGGFRLFARESGRFVAVGVPLPQPVGTAVLTAQFHKVGGPVGGGYGLIVRDQGSPGERDGRNQAGHYMVLEVGDQGDAGVWERNEGRWIDVMPWTHSDAVHLDREPNTLTVTMRDSVLRFEVNGTAVADLTYDSIPPRGNIGVFVGGDLNEVVLDSLRIET